MNGTANTKNIYARPPIVEAIIDIRSDDLISSDVLNQCVQLLSSDYPNTSPINDISVDVNIQSPHHQPIYMHEVVGYRMSSHSNEIVVIQKRGFTISQVSEYQGWDIFKNNASIAFQHFLEATQISSINRLALRYVNKVSIPESRFRIEDYFNLTYKIPEQLSSDISGIFMQLQVPMPEIDETALCVINFLSTTPDVENTSAIVLDFDLFIQKKMFLNAFNLFELLDKFRDKKNELFEMCITDKTRELFR